MCKREWRRTKSRKKKKTYKIENTTENKQAQNLALPSCALAAACLPALPLSLSSVIQQRSNNSQTTHNEKTKWGKRFHEKLLHTIFFLWFHTYIKEPGSHSTLERRRSNEPSQRSKFFFEFLFFTLFFSLFIRPNSALLLLAASLSVSWQGEHILEVKKNLFFLKKNIVKWRGWGKRRGRASEKNKHQARNREKISFKKGMQRSTRRQKREELEFFFYFSFLELLWLLLVAAFACAFFSFSSLFFLFLQSSRTVHLDFTTL